MKQQVPFNPVYFQWDVPTGGHRWVRAATNDEPNPKRYLTDEIGLGSRGLEVTRHYPLAAHTGLFRDFAGVEPTEDGVATFAEEFGLLGGECARLIHPTDEPPGPVYHGELLASWVGEVLRMRQLLALWGALNESKIDDLAPHFRLQSSEGGLTSIVYESHPGEKPDRRSRTTRLLTKEVAVIDDDTHRDLVSKFRNGSIAPVVRHYLRRALDAKLEKHSSAARILWIGQSQTELGIHVVPGSLIGALWLQFATAVAGDKQYRSCVNCGRWFEIASGTTRGAARSDRSHCTPTCKSRALRDRRKKVIELHRREVPEAEISKQLNTKVRTIRRWIKQ